MLKRKGSDDVLADIDESKKAKSDAPTGESEKNTYNSPEITAKLLSEKATEIIPAIATVEISKAGNEFTNPTIGADPAPEEPTENKCTEPTVETSKAEEEFSNPTIVEDPAPEESTENKSTELTVETSKAEEEFINHTIAEDPAPEKSTENKSKEPTAETSQAGKELANPTIGADAPEESTENKSTEPTAETSQAGKEFTNSTIGTDPAPEESTENKYTEPTVETSKAEEEFSNPKIEAEPAPEVSTDEPTVETLTAKPELAISATRPDLMNGESMEIEPTKPAAKKPDKDASKYMQVIITGPPKCGKSCLVLSYMEQLFPPMCGEFLSKQYLHILPENNQPVMIWDLDARPEFTGYRYQSYKEADIALLCFNVKMPKNSPGVSLESLLLPWITELDCHCKEIPVILVGLMGDLRINTNRKCFGEDDIKKVMESYPRIVIYKEVSSFMDRDGVEKLFATVIGFTSVQKPKVMFTSRVS